MKKFARTDLAVEAKTLWEQTAEETTQLPGVQAREENRSGFPVSTVRILDERGSHELCKPIGDYVTVGLDAMLRRQEDSFEHAVQLLAELLREQLPLTPDASVLVVGLGNRAITPDAIGPVTVDNVMVTRHLRQQMPQEFAAFRSVSAVASGVLGTTGIEAAELVHALVDDLHPDAVIAVDALACAEFDRLCRTIQLTNTGITPGSGVGNDRAALSRETLSVPVVAIGVPTVVDAGTFAQDARADGMFVTQRNIDSVVHDISRIAGYGINLALHDGLTIGDIDLFLS